MEGKTHRFYQVTYSRPTVRYAGYWGIPVTDTEDAYRLIFMDGWSARRVAKYLTRVNGKDIKSFWVHKFVQACNKYHTILEIRAELWNSRHPKRAQSVSRDYARAHFLRKPTGFPPVDNEE